MIRVALMILFVFALAPGRTCAQASSATGADAQALEARTLFEEGVRASRDERWAEALDLFRRSRALVPRPSTLFNIVIALDRLGRPRATIAAIDEYVARSDADADARDREEAMRLRLEAEARLARVVVRVDPGDAQVSLDGEPIAGEGARRDVVTDPGDHVLVVSAPGHVEQRQTLTLRAGSEVERVIVLAPSERVVAPPAALEPAPVEVPSDGGLAGDPVFWAILGASVAVIAGVAIGVGVHVASAPQPYGGTLGIVFDAP